MIEQTGILKGRRRRAVDSTILADAVATRDTVTQLVSAVRWVAREVPVPPRRSRRYAPGMITLAPGKPKIEWDDPAAKEALVSDAKALMAVFAEVTLDEPATSAVALLALVAGQDVEHAEGSLGACKACNAIRSSSAGS